MLCLHHLGQEEGNGMKKTRMKPILNRKNKKSAEEVEEINNLEELERGILKHDEKKDIYNSINYT